MNYIMIEDLRTEWCEECNFEARTTFGCFNDSGLVGELVICVVCDERRAEGN